MSKPKYADPRDEVERELLVVVSQLGGSWFSGPPLDGWCHSKRFGWVPVEIKAPEREGLAHEYTPMQKRFFAWAKLRECPFFVWRNIDDVVRDLGGVRSA